MQETKSQLNFVKITTAYSILFLTYFTQMDAYED